MDLYFKRLSNLSSSASTTSSTEHESTITNSTLKSLSSSSSSTTSTTSTSTSSLWNPYQDTESLTFPASITTTPITPLVAITQEAYTAANNTLSLINELDNHHQQISSRTTIIHEEFRRLIQQEQKLSLIIQRVYKPLSYYESLYIIGKRLGIQFTPTEITDLHTLLREMQQFDIPSTTTNESKENNPHKIRPNDLPLHPTDEEFPLALERIDECISFLASHTQYKDNTKWLNQFKELQTKALLLIKNNIIEMVEKVVDGAQQEINKAIQQNNTMNTVNNEGIVITSPISMEAIEMAQLQLRFRTELISLRKLIYLVEIRANRRNGAEMLTECYRAFLDKRLELITSIFRSKLSRIAYDRTKELRKILTKNNSLNTMNTSGMNNTNTSNDNPPGNMAGSASVYSTYTAGTVGTRVTTLWSEDVTTRESCVVDMARTCAALMARASQAEHQLFHNLFTIPYNPPGGSSSSLSSVPSEMYEGDDNASTTYPLSSPGQSRTLQKLPSSSSSVISSHTKQTFGTLRTKTPTVAGTLNMIPSHIRTCADTALNEMQEEFCTLFTEILRPYILNVNSLDVLCDIVRVLRDEVLTELVYPRGSVLQPFSRVVTTLIKDIQERIVFRASGFITERIENYKVSNTNQTITIDIPFTINSTIEVIGKRWLINGDNDFLGKLLSYYMRLRGYNKYTQEKIKQEKLKLNITNNTNNIPDDHSTIEELGIQLHDIKNSLMEEPIIPPSLYDSWSPIIECTLALFTRLYQIIEPEAFDNLAQDAVTACTNALQRQAVTITNNISVYNGERIDQYFINHMVKVQEITNITNNIPQFKDTVANIYNWNTGLATAALRFQHISPSTASSLSARIDGQLYLIKNLLILREQLSPFEMQLSTTTRSLDFSSTSDAFGTLISSLSSVFSLSRNNALLSFVATSLPTVQEQKIDGRIQLESLLKLNCELLITFSIELLFGNIPQTLEKYLYSNNKSDANTNNNAIPIDLLESLWITKFSISDFFTNLSSLRRRLGFYLGSSITAAILFRPIKDQLLGIIKKILQNIQINYASSLGTISIKEEETSPTISDSELPKEISPSSSNTTKEYIIQQLLYKLQYIIERSEILNTDPTSLDYGYDNLEQLSSSK